MALYVCLISVVLTLECARADPVGTTVVTAKGKLIGQNAIDGNYITFFGVPYAKVDEGNPFGLSLKNPDFDKPFKASDPNIICPQANESGPGEQGILQCLRLNIYVPSSARTEVPLPVLLWFHGGDFSYRGSHEVNGKYLAQQGVVVVAANYRLGPYGFLCLDDPKVPGNQGLKDQMEALRWVSKHIGRFGGDRNAVTIGGEGAGGASVDLHLYSNYEKLFDKVAIHSGSMFAEGMFTAPDYDAASKLAHYLGRSSTSTTDSFIILNKASPHKVVRAYKDLGLELRPCQERKFKGVLSFINNNLFELGLMTPSKIRSMKILTGYDNKERLKFFGDKNAPDYFKLQNIFYDKLGKNFVFSETELKKLADIVQMFYLGSKNITKDAMLQLSDFASDFMTNHAVETSVSKYVRYGASVIYKWSFSFVSDDRFMEVPGAGASHTDEVQYIFGQKFNNVTEEQRLMMEIMVAMWSNFIKYGNPTPGDRNRTLLPVDWVPLTSEFPKRRYLNINTQMEMREQLYHERMAFWDLFWNNYWRNSVLVQDYLSSSSYHHHNKK